jgi:hypothetical protein
MNFKVGMYVEHHDVKGYIHCITDDYFSICINSDSENLYCCVLCYKQYWNEVICPSGVPPVYPISNIGMRIK